MNISPIPLTYDSYLYDPHLGRISRFLQVFPLEFTLVPVDPLGDLLEVGLLLRILGSLFQISADFLGPQGGWALTLVGLAF